MAFRNKTMLSLKAHFLLQHWKDSVQNIWIKTTDLQHCSITQKWVSSYIIEAAFWFYFWRIWGLQVIPLLSWKWLNICQPVGSSEWTLYFAFFMKFMLFLLNYICINSRLFALLPFWVSSTCGEWVRGCVGLSCLLGSTHTTSIT